MQKKRQHFLFENRTNTRAQPRLSNAKNIETRQNKRKEKQIVSKAANLWPDERSDQGANEKVAESKFNRRTNYKQPSASSSSRRIWPCSKNPKQEEGEDLGKIYFSILWFPLYEQFPIFFVIWASLIICVWFVWSTEIDKLKQFASQTWTTTFTFGSFVNKTFDKRQFQITISITDQQLVRSLQIPFDRPIHKHMTFRWQSVRYLQSMLDLTEILILGERDKSKSGLIRSDVWHSPHVLLLTIQFAALLSGVAQLQIIATTNESKIIWSASKKRTFFFLRHFLFKQIVCSAFNKLRQIANCFGIKWRLISIYTSFFQVKLRRLSV